MVFRVRYQNQGDHAFCSLYVAIAPDRTFALAGTFGLKHEEFEELRKQCPKIQFRNASGEPLRPYIDRTP